MDHFQKKPPPNLNIRFGSLADILAINRDGCFTSKADIHERDRHVRYGPILLQKSAMTGAWRLARTYSS
jgi:hypothetical protein